MNLVRAKAALLYNIRVDAPTFLWGAIGIGKSDLVREVGRELGMNVIDLRTTLLDPVDLRGLPFVRDGLSHWAPPSFFPNVERDGEEGILFFDEMNQAAPSVQSACYQIVLDRRSGEYIMPKGWRIVAAGNRQADRSNVQRQPAALANRFTHLDVEVEVNAWVDWAKANKIDRRVITFIQHQNAMLHKMEGDDLRAFPTPRSWASVSKIMDAPDDLRPTLVEARVGKGAMSMFEAFIETWRDLPDLRQVLRDPKNAPLPPPNKAGVNYIVAGWLATNASLENFEAILTYAGRLTPEMEVMVVQQAVRDHKDIDLKKTPGFTQWALKHPQVTF